MELAKRLISAAVMIIIVVASLLIGKITTFALVCAIEFMMMFDVVNALNSGGYKVNRIILLLAAILAIPAVYVYSSVGYMLVCAVAVTALAVYTVFNKAHDFKGMLAGFFALIYPLLPGSMLIMIIVHDMKSDGRFGMILLVGTVLCACLSDAFAYFGGHLFGKRKLCPEISPKKTVAGSIASFAGGVVGGVIMALLTNMLTEIGWIMWLVIGLLCGGFAQIGDLIASMLKRFCGIKDYGKYIPGHGGVMDRMDSISICLFATVPLAHIFITEIL